MTDRFPEYTTDYISGVMSLLQPQSESLAILDKILNSVKLRKGMDTKSALDSVHELYQTCTDFEREFMSLTFALATGVGKTHLMGAFITYLYTNHDMKNFFVVAPNTTIYEKLKQDLLNPDSEKYVFRGAGCFSMPPRVYTEQDYKSRQIGLNDVRIFIYNIDKFNKEDARMRRINEYLGNLFYNYLSSLPDLVLIMDEAHHYRAERGAAALNELNPVLGLELTATPKVNKGSKQILFKNVVYEYALSRAIEDGFTRTPYALTRSDINFYGFGDENLDKTKINDGIKSHETTREKLRLYALEHDTKRVKPFMLIVCKDTNHAEWVKNYVCSKDFCGGKYIDKTLIIHSKRKGTESDENIRLLREVEDFQNPIEIVIHVNMLKEGWDVNNLYTIVPLRTAASEILREQMLGRGLRLPYGRRTGDKDVDAVKVTAHEKFDALIREAQKGDSLIKAGNIIVFNEIEPEEFISPQININFEPDIVLEEAYSSTRITRDEKTDAVITKANELIKHEVSDCMQHSPEHAVTPAKVHEITEKVKQEIASDKDLAEVYRENEMPLAAWINQQTKRTNIEAAKKFIPIPRIKITEAGADELMFRDFELDLSSFTHAPTGNEIIIQDLTNMRNREIVKGSLIDFGAFSPKTALMDELCNKPEINYEKCFGLLLKNIIKVCDHYEAKYGSNGMRNIIIFNKYDIANKIYDQILKNLQREQGFIHEEIIDPSNYNLRPNYNCTRKADLYDDFTGYIHSILFTGIKKSVFDNVKFDSREGELSLARLLENDSYVQNWLRPAPQEFNITYNNGRRYEPDFVIETSDTIYLTEVKGENMLNDPDAIAKKVRGVQYCDLASRWGAANGYKAWQYLFIPADQIKANSSFKQLAHNFQSMRL